MTAEIFKLPSAQIKGVSVDSFGFEASRPKNMSLNCLKLEEALKVSLQCGERNLGSVHSTHILLVKGKRSKGCLQKYKTGRSKNVRIYSRK